MKQNGQYDVIIIGSGLGGLMCAYILANEGYKVCVLEKNKQVGGCLQTFVRDRTIFDTGVHYIGSLDKGQPLYTYFEFFDLNKKLKLRKLDETGFDRLGFSDQPQQYKFAQGYELFIETLTESFPNDRAAIVTYCNKIKEMCNYFPLYQARLEETPHDGLINFDFLTVNAKEFIHSLTSDHRLRAVLSGSNSLYAGVGEKSPFYAHALVMNSYIESSYRCVDGGSLIARLLTSDIMRMGGNVVKRANVSRLIMDAENVRAAVLDDGMEIDGNIFISNIHPANTLDLLDTDKLKKAYRSRIQSLENTISVFIVYLVLKPGAYPYANYNYYHCENNDVWDTAKYTDDNWPMGYGVFFSASSHTATDATGVTLMAYMRFDEMLPWQNTFNTVTKQSERGMAYEDFKRRKAEKLIDRVERQFPGLKAGIQTYYTSTPLSYRDYIGTNDGSLYGILKDSNDPLKTFISPKTKIKNLFLTGQNLNMHGIYGVTVSAIKTCGEIIGQNYLLRKILS